MFVLICAYYFMSGVKFDGVTSEMLQQEVSLFVYIKFELVFLSHLLFYISIDRCECWFLEWNGQE